MLEWFCRITPYELFKNEITIMGVKINTPESFEKAVSFLESMSERLVPTSLCWQIQLSIEKHWYLIS